MDAILRIEMMDAFGVDSVFEGRHRAMMAHTPVSKAATMDSSVLTKAAKDRSTSSARRFCNRWPRELRRQRRGVPFVGVSQTHGDDGLRFQVDRVLGFVRQVRATILHLRDLGVRVMRVLPVVIGDLLRPTSSCTSTGSRCRMRDNVE